MKGHGGLVGTWGENTDGVCAKTRLTAGFRMALPGDKPNSVVRTAATQYLRTTIYLGRTLPYDSSGAPRRITAGGTALH